MFIVQNSFIAHGLRIEKIKQKEINLGEGAYNGRGTQTTKVSWDVARLLRMAAAAAEKIGTKTIKTNVSHLLIPQAAELAKE